MHNDNAQPRTRQVVIVVDLYRLGTHDCSDEAVFEALAKPLKARRLIWAEGHSTEVALRVTAVRKGEPARLPVATR